MTRHRAFTTAAARRRQDPIVWTIDGHDVHLRASLNLADIAPLVDELQAPVAEDANQVTVAASKREALVAAVRAFVEPASHEAFDAVSPDLDMGMMADMVQDLVQEYAGTANPTQPSSSSDGFEITGASSTDGPAPGDSTPSTSA